MRAKALCLTLALIGAAAPGAAETLGKLDISIAGKRQSLKVTDARAGQDTYWNVGSVSIHVTGKNGGTIQLMFEENGTGRGRGARLSVVAADGGLWQDSDGSLKVDITRADNRPPKFAVAGTFSGMIEPVKGGTAYPVSGSFDVLLPRQDFAPTPGPDEVPGQ